MSTTFGNVNKARRGVLSYADPNGLRHNSLNFILNKIRLSPNHVMRAEIRISRLHVFVHRTLTANNNNNNHTIKLTYNL
jgi:hypothetical protein